MADRLAIAPADEALTFARAEIDGRHRLILVSAYENGGVSGVDLTAALEPAMDDPIDAYAAHGYDGLAAFASAGGEQVSVPLAQLALPVRLAGLHIATGTNFPEHAQESTVKDGPFLFPKDVQPTPFDAAVSAGGGLLDYEAELCFVTLADVDLETAPERAGLLLCNDYTDRARLMRHVDPRDITSGKGFTTGKSAPGFLPVGNLFVIPRDLRAFAASVELRLYRNGEIRQSARQSEAIWDFDEVLRQTRGRKATLWAHEGREVGLPIESGRIPARTGILGGTPEGTIFQGVKPATMMRGFLDWIAGGWSRPPTHWVIERYVAQATAARRYLQPGERVRIAVERLGEIDNRIVD
ncbi:MAG: fumarylacetoacetate hydrolase family protein [Parvibaculum sp.]|uniref:fumarylacetoacetate hydrolase family protein n=1 Tax=Parvibaculum sp. TaxID=2024848 RepID=UPI0025F6A452|nr:fumarylacetoacetate hydrolase family protein [Parvibaculum sp.]MCE9648458.1 fumarylacetoacetate hydrolase family protein [Parvibaculum sp.]